MEPEIVLTMAEIKRIAEVFESNFPGKTEFDLGIARRFIDFMQEKQELILDELARVREMRSQEYEWQQYREWKENLSDSEWDMWG